MKNIVSLYAKNFKKYFPLIKSLQTGLLVITGLAGFMSCRCPILNIWTVLGLIFSLTLSISGATILNMCIDRDIDALMKRTCQRPLPSGLIPVKEAMLFGIGISLIGLTTALIMDLLYGLIIFLGLFIDVFIYTLWLKRKTPWSIIWGGISGGMPILAGRVLGYGGLDWVGFAFMLAILFWIPTHILTFAIKNNQDYLDAEIPTLPSKYGLIFARNIIAVSSMLAALFIGASVHGVSLSWGYTRLIMVLSSGLIILSVASVLKPSTKLNFGLFKYASLFMLGTMIMIVFDVL